MEVSIYEENKPTHMATTVNEEGEFFNLNYYLQNYTSSAGKVLFGIKVDMLDGQYKIVKSAETYAISESYVQIKELIMHLAKHTISPYTLNCMVEEWFSANT